jgi:hypothetical protein
MSLSRVLKFFGAWFTYALSAVVLAEVALDGAGVHLMGFVLLGVLCAVVALVVHVALLAIRRRTFG